MLVFMRVSDAGEFARPSSFLYPYSIYLLNGSWISLGKICILRTTIYIDKEVNSREKYQDTPRSSKFTKLPQYPKNYTL